MQANTAVNVMIDVFVKDMKSLLSKSRSLILLYSYNIYCRLPLNYRDGRLVVTEEVCLLETRLTEMLRLLVLIAECTATTKASSLSPVARLKDSEMCMLLTDVSVSTIFLLFRTSSILSLSMYVRLWCCRACLLM